MKYRIQFTCIFAGTPFRYTMQEVVTGLYTGLPTHRMYITGMFYCWRVCNYSVYIRQNIRPHSSTIQYVKGL